MEEPESKVDLVDLARRLKEVRLFTKSEKHLLQGLFSENIDLADRVFQTAWITRQQRHILKKLIIASLEVPPRVCCHRANALEMVNFIDSYKQLEFHDAVYAEFLAHLWDNPQSVALCLSLGEAENPRESQRVVAAVVSSIYGNCMGPDNEQKTLVLLQSLITHQLAESDNPRRLLLKGNCSFSNAFRHFTESLFSAKLYLTAAFHDPIMTVLMDDETCLETNPAKVVEQFTQQERLNKFGPPDSAAYAQKLQAHIENVTSHLVNLCQKFINGLLNNLFCFPQSLDWIISELHKILLKRGKVSGSEIRAMCADLLFNWFICPAIVDPEPLGIISDILVSENARFNLMQIAKILQQLAHRTDSDGTSGILSRFEKNCMSSLLDSLINSLKLSDVPPSAMEVSVLRQNAALITKTDLMRLVSYFREVVSNHPDRPDLRELETCLSSLPTSPPPPMVRNLLSPVMQGGDNFNRHSVTSPTALKNQVAAKVSSVTKKARKSSPDDAEADTASTDGSEAEWEQDDVLVVTMGNHSSECPGMIPESKVLAAASSKKVLPEVTADIPQAVVIPEKHLRFSADASGNSDNMEAMSIGASNSVYSMDMETDIVSNLSGRNTPRSAISMASSTTENQRPEIIDSTQLPNSTNITDQFGKFEIEKQNCDMDKERVMNPEIYSETWSTDVIGSDTSEPPSEANPIEHLKEIVEIQDEEPMMGATAQLDLQHLADITETGSETWSVDVLQSDSEFDRLQEVEDVTPSETQETPSTEGVMEDADVCKAAEGQNTVSSELDEAKRQKFESLGLPPPPPPPSLSVNQQQMNFELTSPSSASILEVPPPLPPRPHVSRGEENLPPALPPRTKPSSFGNPFNGGSTSILQDFDPLASSPGTQDGSGNNPFASSLDGRMQTVKRSLPPGAKPKERSFLPPPPPFPPRGEEANNGTFSGFQPAKGESYNPLYQLHHKGSPGSQGGPSAFRANPMNTDISHVNHAFFDPSFDPSMDIRGEGNLRNSQGTLDQQQPPSLLDHQPPQETKGASPKNPNPQGSADATVNGGELVDKEFGSHLIPRPPSGFETFPNELEFSQSGEFEGLEGSGDKMAADGDKGKSWLKKKFKQINSKMARSRSSRGPQLELEIDSHVSNQRSDDMQVITNPALIKNGFGELNGPEMKASSVPTHSGEDILNKYRGLRRSRSTELLEDGLAPDSSADENSSHSDRPDSTAAEHDSSDQEISSNDGQYAFSDAKRKLQIVLRSADVSSMPWLSRFEEDLGQRELFMSGGGQYPQNELLAFLRALQAEAVNLQDRSLTAQLWETLRCVQSMDNNSCKKLLHSLREDHQRSSVYIAYLVRCRKGLTSTKAHLSRLLERIQRDKEGVNKFFTMVCVRLFLERQEDSIQKFITDFTQLTAADEKTQLVKVFLSTLNDWIAQDPIWATASEVQRMDAEIATERAIMTRVYKLALYPNGDGDIHRDQLLHSHIEKLSKVVTASHKSLQIPEKYQRESPWPAAQAEILNINVYKTPKDKVQCVVRCCSIIMNLLSLANESGGAPGADDFTPVMMFVLIKANPPSLLSTVQYVNSFYIESDSYRPGDDATRGEDTYWWMQFVGAVEYMKTMDYKK